MKKCNNCEILDQTISDESIISNAYFLSMKEYSRSEIFRILAENDDELKIFAIINLSVIENKEEFNLFISHLTGQNSRIREAISYMLCEIEGLDGFFDDKKSKEILLDGISDINPNVVRNLTEFISKSDFLKNELTEPVYFRTKEVLFELSKFIKEDSKFFSNQSKSSKNHTKNKLTFKLYWLLNLISVLNLKKIEDLKSILEKTSKFLDYTIREKTALILSKMDNPPHELLRELKNDENMYVKNQLLC